MDYNKGVLRKRFQLFIGGYQSEIVNIIADRVIQFY